MEQKILLPKLELLKSSLSYNIHVPIEVENKIRVLCREIHNVEWSGILFYKINGSFEDGNLQVECVDIFQMDEGSSGYTEFNMSADVMTYMIDHPELMSEGVYQGLIHSHASMPTFFSDTDTGTLLSEGSDVNHFVSLIVNNAGVYTAGITRRLTVNQKVQEDYTYPSWNDTSINGTKEFTASKTYVQWFNLNVTVDRVNEDEFEILDRIKEIRKAKASKVAQIPYIKPVVQPNAVPSKPTKEDKKEDLPEGNESNLFEDDEDYNFDVPYGKYHFSEELIESIVKQMLTLSLILPNSKTIDIKSWANTMETIFDKRFKDLVDFETAAVNLVDFLINYTEEEEASIYLTPRQATAVLASDVIESLKELPSNKYINSLISICEDYVL